MPSALVMDFFITFLGEAFLVNHSKQKLAVYLEITDLSRRIGKGINATKR